MRRCIAVFRSAVRSATQNVVFFDALPSYIMLTTTVAVAVWQQALPRSSHLGFRVTTRWWCFTTCEQGLLKSQLRMVSSRQTLKNSGRFLLSLRKLSSKTPPSSKRFNKLALRTFKEVPTLLVSAWSTVFSPRFLLATNTLLGMFWFAMADFVQQTQQIKRGVKDTYDHLRTYTLSLAAFPFGFMGHFWYQWLDKRYTGQTLRVVLKKVLLDQILYSPAMWLAFFVILFAIDSSDMKHKVLQSAGRIYLAEWLVFPPAQIVNFYFLPTRYRVFYFMIISFMFDWFASYTIFDRDADLNLLTTNLCICVSLSVFGDFLQQSSTLRRKRKMELSEDPTPSPNRPSTGPCSAIKHCTHQNDNPPPPFTQTSPYDQTLIPPDVSEHELIPYQAGLTSCASHTHLLPGSLGTSVRCEMSDVRYMSDVRDMSQNVRDPGWVPGEQLSTEDEPKSVAADNSQHSLAANSKRQQRNIIDFNPKQQRSNSIDMNAKELTHPLLERSKLRQSERNDVHAQHRKVQSADDGIHVSTKSDNSSQRSAVQSADDGIHVSTESDNSSQRSAVQSADDGIHVSTESDNSSRSLDYDYLRTRNIGFASVPLGLICHYWYLWLDRRFVGRTVNIVLKKLVLDQLVLSPIGWAAYLASLSALDALGQCHGVGLKERVLDAGVHLYAAEWIVWPPAQLINFYFLPTRFRLIYDNLISLGFDWYSSFVIYDKA